MLATAGLNNLPMEASGISLPQAILVQKKGGSCEIFRGTYILAENGGLVREFSPDSIFFYFHPYLGK